MIRIILLTSLLSTLSGCISTPLLAEFSDGTVEVAGEANASLVSGEFQASNDKGLSCNGTYNQFDHSTRLTVKIICSDGRNGTATVLRTGKNLVNGSGTGVLNDGTRIRILIGDAIIYRYGGVVGTTKDANGNSIQDDTSKKVNW